MLLWTEYKLCWAPIYWMSHSLLLAMIVEMESMEVSRERRREIDFFPPFLQWSGTPRRTSLFLHWDSLPESTGHYPEKRRHKDHILLSSRSKPRWIINTCAILIGEIVDRNFGEIISEWCFRTEGPRSAAPFSRNSIPNLVPTKGRHENPLEPKRIWRPHSTISLIFEFRAIQPLFTLYSLQNTNFFNCMLSIYVQESGID